MHIGLFDSGVGGLTVLKELRLEFPQARFSYLGDTARLPYGNKAPETLRKYTLENIDFLDSLQVDAIVIACHSASSVSLDLRESNKKTPIDNVIVPSCEQSLRLSKNKKIGVIATKSTIASQVYSRKINDLEPKAQVYSQACPLLVPLVEEGLIDDDITQMALKRYLSPLVAQGVDTVILGCTHYPILKREIAHFCGNNIQLIDPARSVATMIKSTHEKSPIKEPLQVFLTDHAPHFIEHAQRLLGPNEKMNIQLPS